MAYENFLVYWNQIRIAALCMHSSDKINVLFYSSISRLKGLMTDGQ
jgi:hypothetical protein